MSIALSRLAFTAYIRIAGPTHITATPFGQFGADPRCAPSEWCFFDARCAADQVDALLQTANACWSPDQTNRCIMGHDPATLSYLEPTLAALGWKLHQMPLMIHERPPELAINLAVKIQVVDAATDALYHEIGGRWATPSVHEHRRVQDARLGGEGLIAWLDGEPAGYGGWYLADGLARYRRLGTLPHARKKHVCTTLVRYVQDHPVVRAQEALVIGGGGGTPVYLRCGFVPRGMLWTFISPSPA